MSEQSQTVETPVEEHVLTQPAVGEQLRAARQARGLDLSDAAQMLKLGARQVEALEQGDWQGLPGQTFIRGFVRNYARILQIDPTPLMAELDKVLEKPVSGLVARESSHAEMPRTSGGGSRRDRTVVLFGAALVVLALLAYFLLANDLSALRSNAKGLLDSLSQKPAEPVAEVIAPTAPAESVFPPGVTPQQVMNPQAVTPAEIAVPPRAEGVPVVSEAPPAPVATEPAPVASAPQMRFVFDKESWLDVRDRNNKQIFSQRVAAGTEQTLSGDGPLSLVIGYAPGVRVFWHGQAIDLAPHTKGDVARLVLE